MTGRIIDWEKYENKMDQSEKEYTWEKKILDLEKLFPWRLEWLQEVSKANIICV